MKWQSLPTWQRRTVRLQKLNSRRRFVKNLPQHLSENVQEMLPKKYESKKYTYTERETYNSHFLELETCCCQSGAPLPGRSRVKPKSTGGFSFVLHIFTWRKKKLDRIDIQVKNCEIVRQGFISFAGWELERERRKIQPQPETAIQLIQFRGVFRWEET